MNTKEHLLTIAAEECNEVAHRISKALRFGTEEIQEGQNLTNGQRIVQEFNDLVAAMDLLYEAGLIPYPTNRLMIAGKKIKVKKYLDYSKQQGTLNE